MSDGSSPEMTRRGFLNTARRVIVGGAIGAGAGYLGLPRHDLILSGLFGEKYNDASDQAKKFIKDTYGLDILVGLDEADAKKRNMTADIPNAYDLNRSLGLILEEILKYPPEFLQNNGVKGIRCVSNLKRDGREIGGIVSEFSARRMILSYTARYYELGRKEYRGAIHHELFHLLDVNDGGFKPDDEAWSDFHICSSCQLNESVGETKVNDNTYTNIEMFINAYGQKSPTEDRAEFASMMMRPAEHIKFVLRMETETNEQTKLILEKKYQSMKGYFFKWSNGVMNDDYWKDMLDGKVQGNYFFPQAQSK